MRRFVVPLLLSLVACEDVVPLEGLGAPPCTFDGTGGLCRTDRCEIVVPEGAFGVATFVELTTEAVPPTLEVEAVGATLCRVGPPDITFAVPAELRIHYPDDEIADGFDLFDLVAFTVDRDGRIEKAAATDAYPSFDRIALPIQEATLAGATIVPSDIRLETEIGRSKIDVTDPASYLANLSARPFRGVFFDGERLYLGNGPRVLVWTSGIPTDPLTPPDLVLGKANLGDDSSIVDASNIVGNVEDIWSDGERLVVSAGHRIMIWERRPTTSHAPADLVLGQETFDTNGANFGGGPSAQSFFTPDEITSDGTRLLVADTSNHRVLLWNEFPRLFGQPADVVIGQPAFDRNSLRGGAIPLYQPRGVYLDAERLLVTSSLGCTCALGIEGSPVDSNPLADFTIGGENGVRRVTPNAFAQASAMSAIGGGGLALRDTGGNRVNIWRQFPTSADRAPDVYVGKPSGDIGGDLITGVNAASLANDAGAHGGLYADEQRLIVADETRVLFWHEIPTTNFEPADLVIGQPTFTTAQRGVDYAGVADDALAHPRGLSVLGPRRAIADESNNRVLIVDGNQTIVLGQPDTSSFRPNRGSTPRADTLSGPTDAELIGDGLVVVDSGNHRVLFWRSFPTVSGAPADVVLGQPTFDTGKVNAGAPDVDKDGDRDASTQTMFYPKRAVVARDRLYVADTFNHRVLAFEFPPQTNAAATFVIGQNEFGGNDPNRGAGWFERSADSLALPTGLAFEGNSLYVADRENNRVLVFDDPAGTDDIADRIIGQPDFESDDAPNFQPSTGGNRGLPRTGAQLVTSAVTLRRPEDLVVTSDRIVVADTGNHRLLGYARPIATAPIGATLLFGQSDYEQRVPDADGIGASSLEGPAGLAVDDGVLYVSDADNHRMLEFDLESILTDTRPEARTVFGQIDMLGHGINKSAASPGRLSNPTGVAHDGERLWVTDRDHHRVLAYDGEAPAFALGQPSLDRFLENAGGEPSANTLASPTDVHADRERLIVVDRHNHRVLIWSPPPKDGPRPADIVVGQSDFDRGEPNGGRGLDGPGDDTLYAPQGVTYADGRLYVADTGNSRVLVYDEPLPVSGARASRVIGQASMTVNRANRGRGEPGADTLASPRDVTVIEGELFVADTLNNRVLVFDDDGDDGNADRVLGQPDFVSRRRQEVSAASMASPTSVTYDGTNVLVADSGHHRVLIYTLVPGVSGSAADRLIGQRSFASGVPSPEESGLSSPARVAVVPLALNDTRVYVADARKNRIAVFRGLSRIPRTR